MAFFYKWSKISNIRRWQSWKAIFRDFGWRCKNVMNKTKLRKLLQLLLIEGILHPRDVSSPINSGISYQPQLMQDVFHQLHLQFMAFLPFGLGLSSRGLRFVVHRGTEGFGDRLQQLLMAMRYARATGRALVIDWRDAKCLGPKLAQAVFCVFFSVGSTTLSWMNEVMGYVMDDLQILYVWNFGGEIDITISKSMLDCFDRLNFWMIFGIWVDANLMARA